MTLSRLHICTTCERGKPLAPDETSRGRQLLQAVQEQIKQIEFGPNFDLRQANCLNGCLNPCNVAFRGHGKYNLRFSRLSPEDAPEILAFAVEYLASEDGNVPRENWPEVLQDKLTVCTPPPRLA